MKNLIIFAYKKRNCSDSTYAIGGGGGGGFGTFESTLSGGGGGASGIA